MRALAFFAVVWCLLSAAARADGPVVLKVGGAYSAWGIPDPNDTSAIGRARRAVFEAFTKQHPDIKLERFSALNIQGPAAESGILMAFAGGTAPDIVYVNLRLMRQYIGQGFLQPLDPLLAEHPDTLVRVHPNIRKELDVDGHIYAVPSTQYVQALYYRKDLFRAAGLDPDRPPRDWDEFYADAQKLTDPTKGTWGFILSQGDHSWYWINFLYSAGGDVTKRTEGGGWAAAFDTPAGAQALTFWRKLLVDTWRHPSGKTVTGVATRSTTFAQDVSLGKVGMWLAYQSDDLTNMNQYDLNPSLIGIAAMPKGPTGLSANEINASMWGVNATVTDPKKRAASYAFLRFMGSEEAAKIRVNAYVENGLGPMVNPVELKKWGFDEYITAAARPWLTANQQLFANGKPEPSGPNMAFIYKLLDEPLDQAILYPDRPVETILRDAATKIDRKLLNVTPPDVMARNRRTASLIAGGLALLLSAATVRALWAAWRARRPGGVSGKLPLRTHLIAWCFMAPAVLSIALWAYLPLLRGMVMAFQDYRILGGSRWVGLDNFIEAAGQETFWKGVVNAFQFTAWLLGTGFVLPIVLALMLHEIPRGKVLFRMLYYLPAVTTSVIVAMLWRQFFDAAPTGLANTVKAFFDPILSWLPNALWPDGPQKWLQDPVQAKFCIVLPLVWAGAGPGSIIYLAALQSVPDEMYEAADLDGAGVFTKVFRITLPTLMPLVIINLVGATIGAFKIMEPVLVQTGGGPDNATYTIGLEVWYNAFMYLKFGYATAAAWMMGTVLVALTIYQLRVLQGVRFSTAGK